MRIDNVNLRVIKSNGVTEVFVTKDDPLMNFVMHLDASADLESGVYSLSFTKAEEAKKETGRKVG